MEPVFVKLLKVAVECTLVAIFTHPDNLHGVVARPIDILAVEVTESLVK